MPIPTETPSPTATSNSEPVPEPVTLSGTGNGLTEAFPLTEGLYVVSSTHAGGTSNVIGNLLNQASGETASLLGNEIGVFTDDAATQSTESQLMLLTVEGDSRQLYAQHQVARPQWGQMVALRYLGTHRSLHRL